MRITARRALCCLAAGALSCLPATAALTPSQMMANVYRLSEASAVLDICFDSAAFKSLPEERAARLRTLSQRIGALVRSIGRYYGDESLSGTYDATRAWIASDAKLAQQVKDRYGYCDERLGASMEAYVAENEALINRFLAQPRSKSVQRRRPDPPPVPR